MKVAFTKKEQEQIETTLIRAFIDAENNHEQEKNLIQVAKTLGLEATVWAFENNRIEKSV